MQLRICAINQGILIILGALLFHCAHCLPMHPYWIKQLPYSLPYPPGHLFPTGGGSSKWLQWNSVCLRPDRLWEELHHDGCGGPACQQRDNPAGL